MSGFDPTWLDLREGADHRARNTDVLAACATHFAACDHLHVVDLGCGLGSNLRALAPHLPERQSWRLVDYDPVLLAAARERLARWADGAETLGDGRLRVAHAGRTIDVTFVQADLAHGAGGVLKGAELVTAAALFDLVSEKWLKIFVADVAAAGAPFYTALTYDGVESWAPSHASDGQMLTAFHAHQARDKGFGAAAGRRATEILARLFNARDYVTAKGDSAWRLGDEDRALIEALAHGVADAGAETGLVSRDVVSAWRAARIKAHATIGHLDLFARPA